MTSWRLASEAGDAEVLLDEEEADPFLHEALARPDEVLDDRRRKPLGGLVHDQELGVAEKSTRDREHLLLSARELRAPTLRRSASRGNSSQIASFFQRPPFALPSILRCSSVESEGNKPPPLRDVADSCAGDLVGLPAHELFSLEPDGPAAPAP